MEAVNDGAGDGDGAGYGAGYGFGAGFGGLAWVNPARGRLPGPHG